MTELIDNIGGTTLLEGAGAALGLLWIAIGIWGWLHIRDGRTAIAEPIQDNMIGRRAYQMQTYIAAGAIVTVVMAIGVSVPDPPYLTLYGVAVRFGYIALPALFIRLAGVQVAGWSTFQEILGSSNLIPTLDERIGEQKRIGRQFAHQARGDLAGLSGMLELIRQGRIEAGLPPDEKVEQAYTQALAASESVSDMQQVIRDIGHLSPQGDK